MNKRNTLASLVVAGSLLGGAGVTQTATASGASTTAKTTTFHGSVKRTLIRTLVHAAPSNSSRITSTLAPGTAISGTIQGDWLKLAQGGYVSRALITSQALKNGAVPASMLCNVPTAWNSPGSWAPGYTPKTVRKLDCYALKSLTGLENAYKAKFGRYARIDLTYRPLSEQYYWFDKFGSPRAARPGTSNHGLGVAVDFRETDVKGEEFGWGGSGYTWLRDNGWKWGYRNSFAYGTSGESYHWDYEGRY